MKTIASDVYQEKLFGFFLVSIGFPWIIFPLIGWGTAVIVHAVAAFYGISLEDKMTERELTKLST